MEERTTDRLLQDLDDIHIRVSRAQRGLFTLIAEADRREAWREDGARDMAHWLSIRYGISWWKADRWIRAAHALEGLGRIAEEFSSGRLSIDKVVELTRFATAETEQRLIRWAMGVSAAAIRRRADLASRPSAEEALEAEEARFLTWWPIDDGRRMGLEAELPASQGAVVARALDRLARTLPVMPGEEEAHFAPARRADALVALCSARIAGDPDPDRATVVVHATMEALAAADRHCEVEGGWLIGPEAARRLACTARIQAVLEDQAGTPLRVGRLHREPPVWMMRQLRYRDGECRFPGCGARRFTQAHHVVWWEYGGPTDLDNLVLVCTFHHRLVHEHGWAVRRYRDGTVRWFRSDGSWYHAGPSPPRDSEERRPALAAVG